MDAKLKILCDKITAETQERLTREGLGCQANLNNAVCSFKPGRKYTKIDQGNSGKYMVVNSTEEIYGIKAYGVIHLGHYYGTLDTIGNYHWEDYQARKKEASNATT